MRRRRALRRAAGLVPAEPQTWLDLGRLLFLQARPTEAEAAVAEGLAASPGEPRLARARAELALARLSSQGAERDWIPGRSEGGELDMAYAAVSGAIAAGVDPDALGWPGVSVLIHVGAHAEALALGDPAALGRRWGAAGAAQGFLIQLPRVGEGRAGRLDLLEQHRLWGERIEAEAVAAPIAALARIRGGGKIRLGFLSADLREHSVALFARPLFEHLDRDRFEVFVHSTYGGETDAVQAGIAGLVDGYRVHSGADPRAVAERIAQERLDMLFDLGGPTGWNRPEVLAWRPAPIQASWLGYPHSLGLKAIDYLLVDPWLKPSDPAMMLEAPLVMPKSWIALHADFFAGLPAPAEAPPSASGAGVTFGTANAPYKYTPACLDAWARVVASTPGSTFLFVRPEAGSAAFRANMRRAFAARGVAEARVRFEAVRGGHLPFYDRIDISLDTFPLTGGTTTCESLCMGVPTVSLAGEAVFERLSCSILSNVGLGELVARDVDGFVLAAVVLARAPERLRQMKRSLRDQVRMSPLGDPEGFARDFYDLVAKTVG